MIITCPLKRSVSFYCTTGRNGCCSLNVVSRTCEKLARRFQAFLLCFQILLVSFKASNFSVCSNPCCNSSVSFFDNRVEVFYFVSVNLSAVSEKEMRSYCCDSGTCRCWSCDCCGFELLWVCFSLSFSVWKFDSLCFEIWLLCDCISEHNIILSPVYSPGRL